MKTSFTVRNKAYEVVLEKRERGEADKFQPFAATVSGQDGGPVKGTLQFTPEALDAAQKKATPGGSADELLAAAAGKALGAEVLIRKLKPEFSLIVDYRWVP